MKTRGWDGTAEDKHRIEDLRKPKDGTWSMVSAAAACDRSLAQVSAFTVLALLGKYRNTTTGECFPSIVLLARMLGITRRSVQRHLDRLVERGYLVVLPRRVKADGAGTRQTSNAYVMLYPPMPAASEDDEGIGSDDTPAENTTSPDEAPAPAAASATSTVAAGRSEALPDLKKDENPLRQMVTTPATHDGKPCDTICRSKGPTLNQPILNRPAAEAGRSRARAKDAAAAGKQSVDPFTVFVRWLAGETRQHEGRMTATALGWVVELEKAGNSDGVSALIEIAKVATASGRGDPVKKITDGVRWHTRHSSPSAT